MAPLAAVSIGSIQKNSIWERHITDSAQLFPLLQSHESVITDFGSGAGFPGIILSILGAKEVHLVESDQRKCAFLTEASRLSHCKIVIHNQRIETISPWKSAVITARALAPLPQLLEWILPFYENTTQILFLKGRNSQGELAEARHHWQFNETLYPSVTASDAAVIELRALTRREKDE